VLYSRGHLTAFLQIQGPVAPAPLLGSSLLWFSLAAYSIRNETAGLGIKHNDIVKATK